MGLVARAERASRCVLEQESFPADLQYTQAGDDTQWLSQRFEAGHAMEECDHLAPFALAHLVPANPVAHAKGAQGLSLQVEGQCRRVYGRGMRDGVPQIAGRAPVIVVVWAGHERRLIMIMPRVFLDFLVKSTT